MTIYNSGPAGYAHGGTGSWTTDSHGVSEQETDHQTWARFTGATALMDAGATIYSATLRITALLDPAPTPETLRIQGELDEDSVLPTGYSGDADSRSMTMEYSDYNVQDQPYVDVDVLDVIQELRANHEGDVIMLRVFTASYAGTSYLFTLELTIDYVGAGGGVPDGDPGSADNPSAMWWAFLV